MNEAELLAAEYALRLLEGEELMEARRRSADDPAFAASVAEWEEHFAALYEDIEAEIPAPGTWDAIVRRLDGEADDASGSTVVVSLRRKLVRWQAGAIAASVAAVVMLALQLTPPDRSTIPAPVEKKQVAPLLLASLAGDQAPEALTVAFNPESRELMITPARIAAPAGRVRELWLIAPGAAPVSLGLVNSAGIQRRQIPAVLARGFQTGSTLALSDEPTGGSPTGQPTGAVLASGSLSQV